MVGHLFSELHDEIIDTHQHYNYHVDTLIFLDEEDEKKNDKENNDGIYNYEQESQERQEQDNSANLSVYKDSPTTRRRRVPNPQHIKLMVYYKTKPTLPSFQYFQHYIFV